MIKYKINNNDNNEFKHCYRVNGVIFQNFKEIKTKFIVFANSEEDAKKKLADFKTKLDVKYNMQTLADVQRAYKKEFGVDVELDSEEFQNYIK